MSNTHNPTEGLDAPFIDEDIGRTEPEKLAEELRVASPPRKITRIDATNYGALQGLLSMTGMDAVHHPERIGSPAGFADEMFDQVWAQTYQFFRKYTHLKPDRLTIYDDMDEMNQYAITGSMMELYAEDASQVDSRRGVPIWVETRNPKIAEEWKTFYDNTGIGDTFTADLQEMGKMGDDFLLTLYNREKGVFGLKYLDPRIVWKYVDKYGVHRGWSLGDKMEEDPVLKPWDVAHLRLVGDRRIEDEIYGTPILMRIRLVYKVLKLMEEQMVIYRMNMHPDRLVFPVPVGKGGNPMAVRMLLNNWRKMIEKNTRWDPKGGQFGFEYAPQGVDQIIYYPQYEGSDAMPQKLQGTTNAMDIFDIEYMRDMLFSGGRVPKAYLGFEKDINAKATLSNQDQRFARGVKRVQRNGLIGYTFAFAVHLQLRGLDPQKAENAFLLRGTPISALEEEQRADQYENRFRAANSFLEIMDRFPEQINQKTFLTYVLTDIAQIESDLVKKLMSQVDDAAVDQDLQGEPEAPPHEQEVYMAAWNKLDHQDQKALTEAVRKCDTLDDFKVLVWGMRDKLDVREEYHTTRRVVKQVMAWEHKRKDGTVIESFKDIGDSKEEVEQHLESHEIPEAQSREHKDEIYHALKQIEERENRSQRIVRNYAN